MSLTFPRAASDNLLLCLFCLLHTLLHLPPMTPHPRGLAPRRKSPPLPSLAPPFRPSQAPGPTHHRRFESRARPWRTNSWLSNTHGRSFGIRNLTRRTAGSCSPGMVRLSPFLARRYCTHRARESASRSRRLVSSKSPSRFLSSATMVSPTSQMSGWVPYRVPELSPACLGGRKLADG